MGRGSLCGCRAYLVREVIGSDASARRPRTGRPHVAKFAAFREQQGKDHDGPHGDISDADVVE